MAVTSVSWAPTTERTICLEGDRGADRRYRTLVAGAGEPHTRRADLAPDAVLGSPRRCLVRLAHLTDLHVADVQSPGRFEFTQRFADTDSPLSALTPSHRPQEALTPHALDAMLRTLNALPPNPAPGESIDLAVATGDLTDNNQANELRLFLQLMTGITVTSDSGATGYEGVQGCAWPDRAYWRPDGCGDAPDIYGEKWSFPTMEGMLEDAVRPFQPAGLSLPWLSLPGNHDYLALGTAIPTSAYQAILAGDRKPYALPVAAEPDFDLPAFIREPAALLCGASVQVSPDTDRRSFDLIEFVAAHMDIAGRPRGHGLAGVSPADLGACYVHDLPDVRLIMLDTASAAGHYEGALGPDRLAWLEQRLVEVHAAHPGSDGQKVATGHQDRLVVICSHHGSEVITNPLEAERRDDLPHPPGSTLRRLLHRFPNVVLWLNGHTHRHTVRPRPDPSGETAGFWEVTTASLVDWPCQARLIEILTGDDDMLSLRVTVVDHGAPIDPLEASGPTRLASLHRLLAANDPYAGACLRGLEGGPGDRNVELLLPAPFRISRHNRGGFS